MVAEAKEMDRRTREDAEEQLLGEMDHLMLNWRDLCQEVFGVPNPFDLPAAFNQSNSIDINLVLRCVLKQQNAVIEKQTVKIHLASCHQFSYHYHLYVVYRIKFMYLQMASGTPFQ